MSPVGFLPICFPPITLAIWGAALLEPRVTSEQLGLTPPERRRLAVFRTKP